MHVHKNMHNNMYRTTPRNASYRPPFRQPYRMHNSNVTGHYCCKVGHIAPVCFTKHRHMHFQSQNKRWVPYKQFAHTNPQGPKFTWVPKQNF